MCIHLYLHVLIVPPWVRYVLVRCRVVDIFRFQYDVYLYISLVLKILPTSYLVNILTNMQVNS